MSYTLLSFLKPTKDMKTFKIAIAVAPAYQRARSKEGLGVYGKEEAVEIHDGVLQGLSPRPNWSCNWLLYERLQEPVLCGGDSYQVFPCVGIVAHVDSSLA